MTKTMSSISQNKANGGNRGGGYSNLHGSDNKWAKNAYGDLNKRLHTGKFSKEESHLVRAAVEDFCAAKQISVARLCSECDHKAELKGAWMEISKRLPHRSVQSVYRHGTRVLGISRFLMFPRTRTYSGVGRPYRLCLLLAYLFDCSLSSFTRIAYFAPFQARGVD